MGGRFGKYGDAKRKAQIRKKVLRKSKVPRFAPCPSSGVAGSGEKL